MKRKRFSEEQIIRILHEAETLANVREVCVSIMLRNRPCLVAPAVWRYGGG